MFSSYQPTRGGRRSAPNSLPLRGSQSTTGSSSSRALSKTPLSFLHDTAADSSIVDPNASIAFKSLSKKDTMTRLRAVEKIRAIAREQSNAASGGGIEEGILEAWARYFPRLTIDEDRRVRETSFEAHMALLQSARKRMERFLLDLAGPWLAGLHDTDKGVARAAQNSLSQFLPTDDKKALFCKKAQTSLINYAKMALCETPETLSDMASTNKDDAMEKYSRVQISVRGLILYMLRTLSNADTAPLESEYREIFDREAMWKTMVSDVRAQRCISYDLFTECLTSRPQLLESQAKPLHKVVILAAQKGNQTGSVIPFYRLLQKLAETMPGVWEMDGDNTHPLVQMKTLFSKGSQNNVVSPGCNVWAEMDKLARLLPSRPISLQDASGVLSALHTALSSRTEPSANAVYGWTTYLSIAKLLINNVDSPDALIESHVLPIFGQYVAQPSGKPSVWATSSQLPIVEAAVFFVSRQAFPKIVETARNEWTKLASDFSSRLAISAPEVSEKFEESHKAIADEARRWFSLVASVHKSAQNIPSESKSTNVAEDVLAGPTLSIMEAAIKVLTARDYKPIGAAQLLKSALTLTPHVVSSDQGKALLASVYPVDDRTALVSLLASPSSSVLISCLNSIAGIDSLQELYESIFAAVVSVLVENAAADPAKAASNMTQLMRGASDAVRATGRRNPELQQFLSNACLSKAQDKAKFGFDFVEAIFETQQLAKANAQEIVYKIGDEIDINNADRALHPLAVLLVIAKNVPGWAGDDDSKIVPLMTKILKLSELQEHKEVLGMASSLNMRLNSEEAGSEQSRKARIASIVRDNLCSTSPDALEVSTLTDLTRRVVRMEDNSGLETLLPDLALWKAELKPFLVAGLNPSVAVMSSIRGAYFLPSLSSTNEPVVDRDPRGRCMVGRMAEYTQRHLELMLSEKFLTCLAPQQRLDMLYSLYLVLAITLDQVAINSRDSLWGDLSLGAENRDAALELANDTIYDIRTTMADIAKKLPEEFDALVEFLLKKKAIVSPAGVYRTRAISLILEARANQRGAPSEQMVQAAGIWTAGSPDHTAGALGFLTGYGELLAPSKTIETYTNRLVAEVSGLNIVPAKMDKTMATLIQLNAAIGVYPTGKVPAPTNRIVFAVKHLSTWIANEQQFPDDATYALEPRLRTETLFALNGLLPCITDIYGVHWERTIRYCIAMCAQAAESDPTDDSHLPWLHAALRLVSTIKALGQADDDDICDDLGDSITLFGDALWASIRKLLLARANFPASCLGRPQPHQIVDAQLARLSRNTPLSKSSKTERYFKLLTSDSSSIQTAGFEFLHRAIPAEQVDNSLEAILQKATGELPSELLEIIMTVPNVNIFDENLPAVDVQRLRTYQLAWKLVFDAFDAASVKIRSDFVDQLNTAGVLEPLWDTTFDTLGHVYGTPLNLEDVGMTRADHIVEYSIDSCNGETNERHALQLFVHLYYLALKHVPNLFRNWLMNVKSKTMAACIGPWTAKYISPMLLDEAFEFVETWADDKDNNGNIVMADEHEREMLITVRRQQREIVASFEFDDSELSMTLQFPADFPVGKIKAEGTNRMLVDAKNWRVWLAMSEGVAAFSNTGLAAAVDGMTAFRRNVLGRIKGQAECAICYCFVAEDKRLPDVTCGTCKNTFHKFCLYRWMNSSSQNTCPLCRQPVGIHTGSKPRNLDVM